MPIKHSAIIKFFNFSHLVLVYSTRCMGNRHMEGMKVCRYNMFALDGFVFLTDSLICISGESGFYLPEPLHLAGSSPLPCPQLGQVTLHSRYKLTVTFMPPHAGSFMQGHLVTLFNPLNPFFSPRCPLATHQPLLKHDYKSWLFAY